MSDFLTRLVERQAGTAAVVQPRTPSMFAPPVNRTGPADFPVIDSSASIEDASPRPAVSIRSEDHGGEVLIQTSQQYGGGPVPHSPSSPRAAEKPRRAESAPTPLVRNTSPIVNQSAHAMPAAPRADALTTPAQALPQQTGPSGQHIEDRVASVPVHPAARMAPLPRLVETRHQTPRSSAAAPPSLLSGIVTGRRTEPTPHAVSTEPPVEVTIGRIEVTAVSTAPDTKRKPGTRRPAMSLEEYLTRRQGGRP